ncbi:polysaccharide pyruvyl transferase family protein [Pseudobutyrivibrio xylanivorans]|uniref:polysaccharide pyruvyl transferase family protein n=1 Tax=Pseudobutyrivibrio xylanivorans TaxID=185007 RepID=UPI00142E982D|nr:polysaccharide pyruvyl transferase family protein [Pseudobutyrivibrio xylanivorans]
MKYGRITYYDVNSELTEYTNIGDWCQTFAIDNLYEKLGVSKSDIIDINRSELPTYKGEKLLVVIQADCRQLDRRDFFPLSDDIVPVYLGIHRTEKKHILNSIDRFTEIIGCRDEATCIMFKSLGYNAFISGCLTLTLPKRPEIGDYTELYLVDVPHEINKYIPSAYAGHVHKVTHEIFNSKNPEDESRKIYDEYRRKARLVVTSRLHCLVPCLAMGIPVVLVRKYYDDRYGFVEKYVKPYLVEELSEINWDVEPVDVDEIKLLIMDVAKSMINKKVSSEGWHINDLSQEMKKLDIYYDKRKRVQYESPFMTKMYYRINRISPKLARFIRLKLLVRFTVIEK